MSAQFPMQTVDMAEAPHHAGAIHQDFAIQAVARQIYQPSAALEYPAFDGLVHFARPVFRMNRQYEHTIGVEVQRAVVQLRFGVKVVIEALPLEPPEQAPLSRRHAALDTPLHRVHDFRIVKQVVVRFRTIERQRLELFILPPPSSSCRAFTVGHSGSPLGWM